ncbi:MAG: CDP-diacylglycerol--glycerol-3-phosphate 3-phosphatidyltransferase [Planctomycetota bacterium]|nr:CDP-diacylglycerol--glycerol-3-phosphate 3-phosphatidyltransferase [Planctomycetota bacterium]MDA1164533.1 CDP-diacylglycerol--glycerol-3-phosphate 3-phosphatidyltransferase [Planctomycetota bacterium]
MTDSGNGTGSTSSTGPQMPEPVDRRSLNLPNLITLSRLGLAVILFWLIYVEGFWISAAILFVVAAATDAIDGYIARKYGQVTTLGRILDPFVDKIIICGAFVFLLEKKADSGVNSWMVMSVIGREMFVTGLRSFLEQSGNDFSAALIGKIKMALQCVAVTASLLSLSPEVGGPGFNLFRDIVLWAAVVVTLYSGLTYAIRGFQMLRPPKPH